MRARGPLERRLTPPRDTAGRRIVDVLVAVTGLVAFGPLLAGLMVAVRRSSPGPAIFRQTRVGRDETVFVILKLRTMADGSDRQGALVTGSTDPRVTPLGRWLRATRLDELPQLVNLLRGDMTLVGPRPEVPRFLPYYTDEERHLLRVRPGVIGPGALHFASEQAQELDDAEDPEAAYVTRHLHPKLQLDLDYLASRSLRDDLGLLVATARLVLGRG
ncbi:MAG: sugar transferase [Nocardioides sp.]